MEITVSRNINSNTKGRKGAKEIFFMNYFFVDLRRDGFKHDTDFG